MAFLYLKRKLTLLEKTSKENELLLKSIKSCSIHILFSSCVQHAQPFYVRIEKIIFTVFKIQVMRNRNNLATTSFAGLFLTIVRFNLLEWWHSHKNEETYPFFFLEETSLYRNISLHDGVQIWRSKLQYTLHLKSLVQLLIYFSYCRVAARKKLFCIYKKQTVIFIFVEDVIWFFGSNIECFE